MNGDGYQGSSSPHAGGARHETATPTRGADRSPAAAPSDRTKRPAGHLASNLSTDHARARARFGIADVSLLGVREHRGGASQRTRRALLGAQYRVIVQALDQTRTSEPNSAIAVTDPTAETTNPLAMPRGDSPLRPHLPSVS